MDALCRYADRIFVTAMNISGEVSYKMVTDGQSPQPLSSVSSQESSRPSKLHSGPVIALFVLGSLVLIIGSIYAYIYFKKISPQRARARKYMDPCAQDDDGGPQGTHLFLFRKSWSSLHSSSTWTCVPRMMIRGTRTPTAPPSGDHNRTSSCLGC